MLKTLRITSLSVAAVAVMGVIFVLIFGLRPNEKIRWFLDQESIVEQMRKQKQSVVLKDDTISPLVTQAKAFALRIDPPPPPPPPPPKPGPTQNTQTPTAVKPPSPPPPPPPRATNFKLVATARYTDYPKKSMALLDLVSEGLKWFRQGDDVGHFKINQVKDGSIVLYQNGKFSSELSVPPQPQTVKSLLKSDAGSGPAGVSVPAGASASAEVKPPVLPSAAPADKQQIRPVRITTQRTGQDESPAAAAMRSPRVPAPEPVPVPVPVPVPEPKPEPVMTLQQQKESLDESINSVREMIGSPPAGSRDPAALAEDAKAWKELLEILEQERKNLDNTEEETSDKTKSEPAKDKGSEAGQDGKSTE